MMELTYPIPVSPNMKNKPLYNDVDFYEDTVDEFRNLLTSEMYVDLSKLQQLSRYGVPESLRGEVWKYLLKTESSDRSTDMERSKEREEGYQQLIMYNYEEQNRVRGEVSRLQQKLKRTLPVASYERIIGAYLSFKKQAEFRPEWVHLATPFIMVVNKESDAFFCFEHLMERIEDFMGTDILSDKVTSFKSLFRKIIPDLFDYFEEEQVYVHEWAPNWLRYLLSKELPLDSLLPLWDIYFGTPDFMELHMYFCIAILKQFKDYLEELESSEIKAFLSRLPTIDVFTIRQIALDLRHEEMDSSIDEL